MYVLVQEWREKNHTPPSLARVLAPRFREQLEAGPGAVNLRDRCPFYYEVRRCRRVLKLPDRQIGRPASRRRFDRPNGRMAGGGGGGGAAVY